MFKNILKNQKGVTLIELLVVIAIIAIIAVIAVPRLNAATDRAKAGKVAGDMAALGSAISMYVAQDSNNRYPAALADLETAKTIQKVPVGPDGKTAYSYSNGIAVGSWKVDVTTTSYYSDGRAPTT